MCVHKCMSMCICVCVHASVCVVCMYMCSCRCACMKWRPEVNVGVFLGGSTLGFLR